MSTHVNELTNAVIGAAISVHRALGPGLLESAYQTCLAYEFRRRGIPFVREWPLPVNYGEVALDCGYRLDFLVDDRVILEVKAVEKLIAIHEAQLLTYLRLSNNNVERLVDGIRRRVHGRAA